MTIRDADISYLYSVDDQRMYKEVTAQSEIKREYYLSDAFGKVIALRSTVTPTGQGSSTTWEYYAYGPEREARLVKINGGTKFGTDEVSFYLYDYLGSTRINYTPHIEEQQAATNVLFDDQFLGGSLDGWGTSSTGTIVNSGGSLTVSDASNVVAIKNVNMTAGNTYTIELNIDMGSMSSLTLYVSGNSIGALSSGGNTFIYTPVNSGPVGLIINGGTGGNFGIKGAKLTENVPHVLTQNLKINSVMDYFPYGKVLREYVNGEEERYLTTQQERDVETGLDYKGARYYDADIARFLSLDPHAIDYPSLSAYCYVGGNPISFIDPDGRDSIRIFNQWRDKFRKFHKEESHTVFDPHLREDVYLYNTYNSKGKVVHREYVGQVSGRTYIAPTGNVDYFALYQTFSGEDVTSRDVDASDKFYDPAEGGAEAGNNDSNWTGIKGARKFSTGVNYLGIGLQFTGVGAPVGRSLCLVSDIYDSYLDYEEFGPEKAIINTVIRVGISKTGSKLDRSIDAASGLSKGVKQFSKGAQNGVSEEVEGVLTE